MEVFTVIFIITAVQFWCVSEIYVIKNLVKAVQWITRDNDDKGSKDNRNNEQ